MIEIKDLLTRFSNLLLSGEANKKLIQEVIFEVTRVRIQTKDMEIKNGTLYLNTKPIYKNELFLKREEILFKLRESLGKRSPTEIR